jgi:hypothetical protein
MVASARRPSLRHSLAPFAHSPLVLPLRCFWRVIPALSLRHPVRGRSAITISTRSSGTSATSVQTQPPVIFPSRVPLGLLLVRLRRTQLLPAPTLLASRPRRLPPPCAPLRLTAPARFPVYCFYPSCPPRCVLARWGIRGISFSFHWLRKRISPSSTPQQQQGSPELNVPGPSNDDSLSTMTSVHSHYASTFGGSWRRRVRRWSV